MLTDYSVGRLLKLTWSTPFHAGLTASTLLLVFYTLVIWLSSRSLEHLLDLIREDGAFVGAITLGFGVQIALFSYLRSGMHHVSRSATVPERKFPIPTQIPKITASRCAKASIVRPTMRRWIFRVRKFPRLIRYISLRSKIS